MFTDGITEAMNAAEDLFGEDRLGALVEEHADLPFGRAARAHHPRSPRVRRRAGSARRHDPDPC
jgi:hypothetical protein